MKAFLEVEAEKKTEAKLGYYKCHFSILTITTMKSDMIVSCVDRCNAQPNLRSHVNSISEIKEFFFKMDL